MHEVILTPQFERQATSAQMTETELEAIVLTLAENPMCGDLIRGSGGARKMRFAREGRGKSGGYRTVHYFGGYGTPVYLLALIVKTKKDNLSAEELTSIKAEIAGIKHPSVQKEGGK